MQNRTQYTNLLIEYVTMYKELIWLENRSRKTNRKREVNSLTKRGVLIFRLLFKLLGLQSITGFESTIVPLTCKLICLNTGIDNLSEFACEF